jgi:uncharacterized Zn-finger protein
LKENKKEIKCPICTGPMKYKGKIDDVGKRKLWQCPFCKNVEIIYE